MCGRAQFLCFFIVRIEEIHFKIFRLFARFVCLCFVNVAVKAAVFVVLLCSGNMQFALKRRALQKI